MGSHARSRSAPNADVAYKEPREAVYTDQARIPGRERTILEHTDLADITSEANLETPRINHPEADPKELSPQQVKAKRRQAWYTSTLRWQRPKDWSKGRVLVVDYIRSDLLKEHKTKIAAQEFSDVKSLQKFYSDKVRCKQAALRVIHVQNASWAVEYLLNKFNIDAKDDLVGSDFGRWARYEKPEWRAGKPLLKGKTWGTQRDPWRGIRRSAFGMDYLKPYDMRTADKPRRRPVDIIDAKMMELNCYDEQDGACYGYDVLVQRLSVYVQYKDAAGPLPPDDIRNPYSRKQWGKPEDDRKQQENGRAHGRNPQLPALDSLDNGNTIIVFSNSQTGNVWDTLIGARQQIEMRWRQLTFYLPRKDLTTDENLANECMNLIISDIFKGLAVSWETFLNLCETHITIFEDKIYESPADESRAPELWSNSSAWLKVEKLMYIHVDIVKEMMGHLPELTGDDIDEDHHNQMSWLDGTAEQFEKLSNLVQEDLIKPTANLNDLMYKSVGIRDARHSLQLGTSMWRLSWITFIFLPLTFMCGFFGMNTDTFRNNPSIKWYFIAAVPMMVLVFVFWYVLKHLLAARHATPYQRGVYEHLFHDLAVAHPTLWTRIGPRNGVEPIGVFSRMRWRLLRKWFRPEKTILQHGADPDDDGSGFGFWAGTKRRLARRWLSNMEAKPFELGELEERVGFVEYQAETMQVDDTATSGIMVESEPISYRVTRANLEKLSPPQIRGRTSHSSQHGESARPSSSGGSSGMLVEEREVEDGQEREPLFPRSFPVGSIDSVLQTYKRPVL